MNADVAPAPLPAAVTESSPYQRNILAALNGSGRHIYGGTVDPKVVKRRRAANKVAKASRKTNRRTA